MRIWSLVIEHLPGIRDIEVSDLGSGICVVSGANATGKSSLLRAFNAITWDFEDDPQDPARVYMRASWHGINEGTARRSARTTLWMRSDGQPAETEPLLPPELYREGFALKLDELAQLSVSDTHIEATLVAQLNAGVDVSKARDQLAPSTSGLQSAASTLVDLDTSIREIQRQRLTLAGEYQQLSQLNAQRDALREQRAHLDADKTARDLLEAQEKREQIELQLQGFSVLQRSGISSGSSDRFHQLAEAKAKHRANHMERAEDLIEAQKKLERLQHDLLNVSDYALLRELTLVITETDKTRESALAELSALEKERTSLLSELDGRVSATGVTVTKNDVQMLADLWREQLVHEQEVILQHGSVTRYDQELADLALAANTQGVAGSSRFRFSRRRALSVFVLGVLTTTFALWTALTSTPLAWLIVLGIALIFVIYLPLHKRAQINEVDRDDPHLQPKREISFDAEQSARKALAEVVNKIANKAEELGLDRSIDANVLVSQAQEIADTKKLAARVAELTARIDGQSEKVRASQAAFKAQLDRVNTITANASIPHADDLAGVRAALKLAEERDQSFRHERDLLESAKKRAADAKESLEDSSTQLDVFMTKHQLNEALSVEDQVQFLRSLEKDLPVFESLTSELRAITLSINNLTLELPQNYDPAALGDIEELRKRIAAADQNDVRFEELTAEITRINQAVDHAQHDTRLEKLTAQRSERSEELALMRDQFMVDAAAQLLVDYAREQYRADSAPQILSQANRILERATDGVYRLDLRNDSLVARVSNARLGDELRELKHLSSGTRAQALIALRLAHARSVEHPDEPLPIFIDEALATTDPQRFGAIIRVLGEISRDDARQIIMLTTDPRDSARVDVALSDAGLAPATHCTIAGTNFYDTIEALPDPVPTPEPRADELPEIYAARIGVPGSLDLYESIDSQHVWHLLEPNLAAVYSLVSRRCETIGQVRRWLAGGLLSDGAGSLSKQEIQGLLVAADTITYIWRSANARPIRSPEELRQLLQSAGVKEQTWLEPLWEYLEKHQGSAQELLDALTERRIPRFRAVDLQALEHAIITSPLGHIPREAGLDDATMIAQALAELGSSSSTPTARGLIERWVARTTV